RRRLYRFDTSGKTLQGFSTSVSSEPTGSPTIAEFSGQQIILIPAKDRIMAYDMEGGPVSGWDNARIEGELLGPINFIDQQAVVDRSFGRIYLFDQTGKKTKEIDIPGDVTFVGSMGIVNKENNYEFYCTDNEGKLHQIKADGTSKV